MKEKFETLKTIYLLVNLQKNTGWFSSYLLADLKLRKIILNNYLNYLKEEAFFSLIACERSLCRRPSNILSCMREFPYAIRKRNDEHYRAFRPALTETDLLLFLLT